MNFKTNWVILLKNKVQSTNQIPLCEMNLISRNPGSADISTNTRKFQNFGTKKIFAVIYLKFKTKILNLRVLCRFPKKGY